VFLSALRLSFQAPLRLELPLTVAAIAETSRSRLMVRLPLSLPLQKKSDYVPLSGMYCNSCVAKVNSALASLQSHGQINSFTALTLSQPATTINYRPSPPAFTIRTLLLTLTELDEVFSASVVKAPSVISRAREIQAREAKILLWHLVLAFGLAVPVFIIGIVGMVLSKKDSSFRQYWETPVWGGASRGTVTLFPLATIAQFAVGR
jgi:P-type Cu+ transporter